MAKSKIICSAESLESRTLLAAFASLDSSGVLRVQGTPGADEISVSRKADMITARLGTQHVCFPSVDVRAVVVNGLDGDDAIAMHAATTCTLNGGAGDDTLEGGAGLNDLQPDAGNNSLQFDGGSDVVDLSDMGSLDVTAEPSGNGLAFNYGESDVLIPFYTGTVNLSVSGGSAADIFTINGRMAGIPMAINAGGGNDTITLNEYDAGDDFDEVPITLNGGGGDDRINVGSDASQSTVVLGGSGDDYVLMGVSKVSETHDAVDLGTGNDTLDLSAIESPEQEPSTPPVLYAGGGTETVIGPTSIANYSLVANELNNVVYISTEATVQGLGGDDVLALSGNSGSVLSGGKGNDTLIGGRGDNGGIVGDTLVGGPGNDTADYSVALNIQLDELQRFAGFSFSPITASQNISLDNQSNDGAVGEHDNVMSDVENILGGSGNDRLIGDSADNYIAGNAGNDYIHGGDGNDTLAGGGGKDHLYGEAGDDLLEARRGSKDFLDGGDGSDSASYDAGIDSVLNVETFLP